MVAEIQGIRVYQIPKSKSLDPITVYVTQHSERAGKITFDCYGKAWSCYWGGMSQATLEEFFLSCGNDYILGKILEETKQTDFDEINNRAAEAGIELGVTSDVEVAHSATQMAQIFGDDWYMDLPTCQTDEYHYVRKIIDAIKAVFKVEIERQSSLLKDDSGQQPIKSRRKQMGQLRQTFEKFISAPPFEKPIDRRPDSSAWPGNYTAMDVSLAWHAFCAGYRFGWSRPPSSLSSASI